MAPKDKEAVTLTAETKKGEDDEKKKTNNNKKAKEAAAAEETMSEEDMALKERLETSVEILLDTDESTKLEIRQKALDDVIVSELRSATASMTSVPKPLKFLRPHYASLQKLHQTLMKQTTELTNEQKIFRARLADVLAVLAMTMGNSDERESLHFKLNALSDYKSLPSTQQPDEDNLGTWGHEFVRSLAGEIGVEFAERQLEAAAPEDETAPAQATNVDDLLEMVHTIVPFHIAHNAEAEAVDLLIEVQQLKTLLTLDTIDQGNYERICLYLCKTADYMSDPEDLQEMLETAYELFKKQEQHYDALRVALRMNNTDAIPDIFRACKDELVLKQMCLLLGRHRVNYEVDDEDVEGVEGADTDELNELVGNEKLSDQFLKLAQDLDVMDPKTPEDIYKSHLAETGGFSRRREGGGGSNVDSARANLASTYVNAFVNCGFGTDKLMTTDEEWLHRNKDHGMMAATASLGSILLWNVDEGLTQIDKYLYSEKDYVKAGAIMAVGILSSGVRNDADPAIALLTEHIEGDVHILKCAAATGLGIAYAGTAREDVMDLLTPTIEQQSGGGDAATTMMQVSLAGLALGLVYCGKCDDIVGGTIVQRLMEATEEELNHSHARYLCLGLGLLFLNQQEKADAMIEALRTIEHKISKYAVILLETCAYAGSGNVLKVQEMLHHCAEHLTEDAEHQMAAVIGLGLITLSEDVGSEMALRTFDHLLHYCELPIKRAVPLSMAVLHISNPDFSVVDQLSRLTHDPDAEISQNAILGLGLVSAGTNNARVAGLLRQLSEFYSKEAGHIFCVRIAQGLLHMGKGLLGLNPFHSDRMLLQGPALGGVLVLLHSCLDLKSTILDKSHYLLYYLTCAMNPRMLITVKPDMEWRPVTVRVGLAVETVGQAGKPKRITGFQTHQTPVLLGAKERAELGTEEVLALSSSVLEGLVILKDNPDYNPDESMNA
eukprot:CAMPEP_0202462460 /NCGR_PEP_ID=MMETSP1360-20130828/54085_1 /ASSEMBLY_ACC=CAM_ASM_000848 /TAXON_ID=515479 /ORGANISM="Licmophora paradoxa, Strain CCMP2313" /LENGTH=949 /DNA_ID=CAMNT_0049084949 /DNA_START=11 /DNA_END=2860 /DNA_ORIENTATION=+